jgi:hypothetical protein
MRINRLLVFRATPDDLELKTLKNSKLYIHSLKKNKKKRITKIATRSYLNATKT